MIEYKDIHGFTAEQLERLFLSVGWSSGHFPDKLVIAQCGFSIQDGALPMCITSLWT